MTKTPPEPIMSNNNPDRSTHRKPDGSEIPDVVVVYDGKKPPVAGNIKKPVFFAASGGVTRWGPEHEDGQGAA